MRHGRQEAHVRVFNCYQRVFHMPSRGCLTLSGVSHTRSATGPQLKTKHARRGSRVRDGAGRAGLESAGPHSAGRLSSSTRTSGLACPAVLVATAPHAQHHASMLTARAPRTSERVVAASLLLALLLQLILWREILCELERVGVVAPFERGGAEGDQVVHFERVELVLFQLRRRSQERGGPGAIG